METSFGILREFQTDPQQQMGFRHQNPKTQLDLVGFAQQTSENPDANASFRSGNIIN